MKITNNIATFLVILLIFGKVQAQEHLEWKLARDKQGVKISYRWLTAPNNTKVREMRAEFHLSAEVPEIVKQFKDSAKYQEWQPGVQECDILLLTENHWDTYVKFHLPWPFSSKDLITRTDFLEAENHFTLSIYSTPKAKAEHRNVDRIKDLKAEWKFIPVGNGSTKVVYTSITYDEPEFPRMLVDPILQNKLIESIGLLKALVTQ